MPAEEIQARYALIRSYGDDVVGARNALEELDARNGLAPRDYSHYTPRQMAQKNSPDACAAGLKSKE
jgi:hypothetical protein